MRNTTSILIAALLASLSYAQENSTSVDGVLSQLENYENAEAPAVTTEEVVAVEQTAPVAEEITLVEEATPAEEVEEISSEPVETIAEPIPVESVPEVIEESRKLYSNGEFDQAKAGFESIIKVAPENLIARMYLRKILEREFKTAEVKGMKAVDAAWDTSMTLRSYEISSDAAEKLNISEMTTASDVISKLPDVSFPKGASAIYQPKMEKLFVRNTLQNLLVLEEVLGAMDAAKLSSDVDQVEIEAKFVEVSEGTLEALGFQWQGTGSGTPYSAGDVSVPDNQYLFDTALRGGPAAGSLPFTVPEALGSGSAPAAGEWSAFRFEDTFATQADTMTLNKNSENNPFNVVISALDQSAGTDVLSAPRIVTKSGEEATIRVGEKHIFPGVYEPSASGGNIVHVSYQDWEERLLGVELSVTPQVDGSQIEMALNPKILELQGWQSYEVAPRDSSYNWYQVYIGNVYDHDPVRASLPILRKREIETQVTIADGATIGMGGLINEKIEAYEDKVPFLGSLPLVGRLFRNEGERAVKRNLLMFVTAKKIEPTGRINSARSFE